MATVRGVCILLSILGITEGSPVDQNHPTCTVANLNTHQYFDSSRHLGKWYLISDYNVDGMIIGNFLDIDDVQAVFYLGESNKLKIDIGKKSTTTFLCDS